MEGKADFPMAYPTFGRYALREFIYSRYHGFRSRMVRHVPDAFENDQLGTR
jgi:hypothetical protein